MKHKYLRFITTIILIYSTLKVSAYYTKIDGIYYDVNLSNKEATVTFLSNSKANADAYIGIITIPSVISIHGVDFKVTTIGSEAFRYCSNLTSIVIPNSIERIENSAFDGCSSLKSFSLPNSIKTIGYGIFDGCTNLTEFHISDIATWCNIGSIINKEYRLFLNDEEVTDLKIPNSITTIHKNTFSFCKSLTSVIIPNTVTSIYEYAFQDCKNLRSVSIGSGINTMGKGVFYGCDALTTVNLNSPAVALRDCSNIMNKNYTSSNNLKNIFGNQVTTYNLGDDLTDIGEYAFYGCSSITNVNFSSKISSIGYHSFCGCTNLTSVKLQEGLKSIGISAFYSCSSLTEITIPSSVESIGRDAFAVCNNLTSVYISDLAKWSGFQGGFTFPFRLYLNGKEIKNLIIPDGVKTISEGPFCHCISLSSIVVPNSVTSINDRAFIECTNVINVTLGDGVLNIGSYAFQGCKNLTSVTLGNSLSTIGAYAFFETRLTNITLPNSLETIGSYAFLFTNISSLTIPDDVRVGREISHGKIYVNSGTHSLIRLWASGYDPYDRITKNSLKRPIMSAISTPTTLRLVLDTLYTDLYCFLGTGKVVKNKVIKETGLTPNQYGCKVIFTVRHSENDRSAEYVQNVPYDIPTLEFTIQQPKVISPGNVIVSAQSNLDDEEENVGFEWRRTDWTDDFASNTGQAYLYEGQMEGYIRNLHSEKLWKVRPYYESALGKRYYGDWIGIDPSNTSYFEPTVHTYASISVNGNTASVRGYAQRGTDNITTRGFKYWENTAEARGFAPSNTIPKNAATVETTGTVMEAELIGLSYETTYSYVAFVTTSEGETFYGDIRQFTTGSNPTGINITTNSEKTAIPTTYYDINGQRHNQPQPGLNIIRFSDGTSRKIFLK